MLRHLVLALCAFVLPLAGTAAPVAEPSTPRILLVGDSWSAYQWRDQVFRDALAARGLSAWEALGDTTAISGSTAEEWTRPDYLGRITTALAENPEIDLVHLSIGGNDFLRADLGDLLGLVAIFFQILEDIETVVAHIHDIDPEIKVVYSIYDYVNVDDGYAGALALFASAISRRAAGIPNFYLVNNLGLLHHRFGVSGAFGPGETPLPGGYPDYDPLLGGQPGTPADPILFRDEIHATAEGYLALAQHSVDEFFVAWLGPQVEISVQPLGRTDLFDPDSAGWVLVVLPGGPDLDAEGLRTETLTLGPLGAKPVRWLPRGLLRDVNGDGELDRVMLFRSQDTGLRPGDTRACVLFDRASGLAAQGCDAIGVAPGR